MIRGTRLAVVAASLGLATGGVAAMAMAAETAKVQPTKDGAAEIFTSTSVSESGPFVITQVEPEGGRGVAMGVRVRRSHERGTVRSWLQVAVVPGLDVPAIGARHEHAGRGADLAMPGVESMMEQHLLVGGLSAGEAGALADGFEAFLAEELPASPEPIRSRTVTRTWTTSSWVGPGIARTPLAVSLSRVDEGVLFTFTVRGGTVPIEVVVDAHALAAALRAGEEQLGLLEAAPPLFDEAGGT